MEVKLSQPRSHSQPAHIPLTPYSLPSSLHFYSRHHLGDLKKKLLTLSMQIYLILRPVTKPLGNFIRSTTQSIRHLGFHHRYDPQNEAVTQ